ncbi:unnamed protein product [Medioppia subpectinata]|uniref:Uncharacterized protein n=1 Tax=Medioppia subpectinata TaxID=1979941 RepID=A0A7R9KBS8_9ACAR|nr:unnamed protein product [Medioppia subpectinata]CAG2100559.1 unnamed protein product [Medioppia subpectinata]
MNKHPIAYPAIRNWHDCWNHYTPDERTWVKTMFCSDCPHIKGDLYRYNECAQHNYPDYHKRIPLCRQHYRRNPNHGHKQCFQEFGQLMGKFTGGYDRFNSCFRKHVRRDNIAKCTRYVYE